MKLKKCLILILIIITLLTVNAVSGANNDTEEIVNDDIELNNNNIELNNKKIYLNSDEQSEMNKIAESYDRTYSFKNDKNIKITIPKHVYNLTGKIKFNAPKSYEGILFINQYKFPIKNGNYVINISDLNLDKQVTGDWESHDAYLLNVKFFNSKKNMNYTLSKFKFQEYDEFSRGESYSSIPHIYNHFEKPDYYNSEKILTYNQLLDFTKAAYNCRNSTLTLTIDNIPYYEISHLNSYQWDCQDFGADWLFYEWSETAAIGDHNITIYYSGDEYFSPANNTITFNYGQKSIEFDKNYENINIQLNDSAEFIHLYINNEQITLNNTHNLTIPLNLTENKNEIRITKEKNGYESLLYYNTLINQTCENEINTNGETIFLNLDKINLQIYNRIENDEFIKNNPDLDDLKYGDYYICEVEFEFVDELNFFVDGKIFDENKIYDSQNIDVAYLDFSKLSAGHHTFKITYDPLNNGHIKTWNFSLNIFKLPKIKIGSETYQKPFSTINVPYGENVEIICNIPKKTKGTVSVYISDDGTKGRNLHYKFLDSKEFINSIAKIHIPFPEIKEHTGYNIKITYNTSNGQYIRYYTLKFPTVSGTNKITIYYNNNAKLSLKASYYNIKLAGKGKTVNFKIDKNSFKLKTNKKSIVTLKIPKLTPGKYTIKAIFHGETNNIKLIVKQNLKIEKVTVKKTANKLVLKATLKNKKPLKNKKITFKFNNKKYIAKTNKNGVAKITIKKSVLNKLTAGKKLTYSATYLKNTVKKTVKIKK